MNAQTLWAPFSVLNAATHSANARLIWLLLCCQPPGERSDLTDVRLRKQSGLHAKTIPALRGRLSEAPLAPCQARPHHGGAAIPVALLTNPDISSGARLLYGQLQSLPDFAHPSGRFTYATLSHLTGSSDDALRRAVADLVAAGWLELAQVHRKSPIKFTLRNPVSAPLRARVSRIRRKVRATKPRGETLLREFLNVLIALDDYEDNASPDFLLNPFTKELMEFDRYYQNVGVAVEFNGAQHYEETEITTFEETVKQVGRDAMKAFLCNAQGIELAIIHPEDLTLNVLDQKLPTRLPRRDLQGVELLVAALEELASEYRERTTEEQARKSTRPGDGLARPGA